VGTNDAHELERFRARLRTLEAQLLAEQKRREAAEAEARASRALAEELCRSGRRVGRRPTSRAGPLVVLMVLCSVSTLLAGIFG